MKLRYYLRGLGIGIFVTALIMTIASGGKGAMTDEEIIRRATELGMVTSSKTLISQAEETVQPSKEEPTKAPEESATAEPTAQPTEAPTEEPTEAPTEEPTEEPVITAEPGEAVTLTVYSGEHSATVARRMEELGLIDNYLDFDDYLCDNGYSRLVNSGIYKIKPGLSYEELAKIITRTN